MTATREAFVLPVIFLSVVLLAGLRVGSAVALEPPSLFALVLGTMLLGALVRSGALAPWRLLHGARPMLANANGAVVLVTLFLAGAQVLAMLTPRSGLPLFFVDVFLFVLLLNTLVAQPDRVRVLRSLVVIFGSALVLKFVVLASLSSPAGSRTTRVIVALFDVATFGTIAQEPQTSGAGYIAFAAIALFLGGLAALPSAQPLSESTALQSRSSR